LRSHQSVISIVKDFARYQKPTLLLLSRNSTASFPSPTHRYFITRPNFGTYQNQTLIGIPLAIPVTLTVITTTSVLYSQ
tara:strand:+ start:372 stop:608 length:237 start_codon:yes stop_codon:yes gene_type:complete